MFFRCVKKIIYYFQDLGFFMFTYERAVYLRETDSTGVIYFTSLFQYALEAFEVFLVEKGYSLAKIFEKGYLMPIVHAEADYKGALKVSDTMKIDLVLFQTGKRSFTMDTTIYTQHNRKIVGRVKIVHAFLKEGEESASEIPSDFLSFISQLSLAT